ncbi:TolC family protein [Achromobacter xylosoxidans]
MMCPPSTCCPSWWRLRLPLPRQGPDHPQHGLGDGQPSLAHPYISTDRDYTQSALTLSWSLLDFGQSYYAARQNADRVRIAAERRRKAIYTLVQDVRTAYWRVVASQALESSLRSARDQAEKRWPTPARPRPSSCARRWSRCATSASCWRTCACWKPSRKNCRRPASSWRR